MIWLKMLDIQLLKQGLEKFSNFEEWDSPSLKFLEGSLLKYKALPSYKKLLYSMICYQDMYQPIKISSKKAIYSPKSKTIVDLENIRRKEKRAEIYMSKRNLIQSQDEKGHKHLVVTSKGEKIFYGDYPLAKLRKQKWNKVWTIIMYDFPETERSHRDRLRTNLVKYGFGGPQISIFISPLPLAEPLQQLIESEGYQDNVWITRAMAFMGKSNTEIAQDAWPLETINNLFLKLSASFTRINQDDKLTIFWKACFLAVDNINPYLPKELLPDPWYEEQCRSLFKKLTSQTFLDAIFG